VKNPKKDEIINSDAENSILSLDALRGQFDALYSQEPDFVRKNLTIYDGYFLTAVGKDAVRRVKKGMGGYEVTRRVVLALKKYVASKEKAKGSLEKLAKRQKLEV
jgi:hypothetical protein